jgi:hypothetical protein
MESKAHHGHDVISLETPPSLGRLVVAVDCIGLEEAPYPCEHCSRSFLSKQALSAAIRTRIRTHRQQAQAEPARSRPILTGAAASRQLARRRRRGSLWSVRPCFRGGSCGELDLGLGSRQGRGGSCTCTGDGLDAQALVRLNIDIYTRTGGRPTSYVSLVPSYFTNLLCTICNKLNYQLLFLCGKIINSCCNIIKVVG